MNASKSAETGSKYLTPYSSYLMQRVCRNSDTLRAPINRQFNDFYGFMREIKIQKNGFSYGNVNNLEIEQMPEFFFFGAEVVGGGFLGVDLDRDAFDDVEAGLFKGFELVGVV